ncbi:sucrase ferredoxin [Streptomyces roseoverticillatus]|uniref:sucrase ferredoxin n=1 Tax=Streptomyces roseoverticillatus TaxID=66429 RepID=UPI001F401FA9|nr:sucrase ferredoxin [Streptomyces roseoverticillatus]MCF3105238.1 sucrase ferredoxin [Streptomyces roseoverticillatus]
MSTCATASRQLAEPLAGTAATARTWLLVEQPGPWGADALTASHLDPAVGRALDAAAEGTGVRIALIRRPGRHADCHQPGTHRVFAAHTAPGRSWIRTAALPDPAELTRLDLAALGAGEHGGLWEAYDGDPLVFVCTNGKRDRCCALLGRPLAAELAASGAEAWEVTHIGGHRFSPTLFVLPYGYAYGRVTAHGVKDVLEAVRDRRIVTGDCRGRSAWERPAQAAELAVRELTGEEDADAFDVTRTEGAAPHWSVTVAHADGRAWKVAVEQGAAEPARPESCGRAPGTPARMDVISVTPLRTDVPAEALTGGRPSRPGVFSPPS